MEPIRINKFLAEAGICSRRDADKIIEAGRVKIDGEIAANGSKVGDGQTVTLDGKPVSVNRDKVVLAFNKPVGIVVTSRDPKSSDTNIIDYINYPERIFPVGRLDKESSGLILLTNDGELANEILKAANYHEKEYEVTVNKPVTSLFLKGMSEGVPILDTVTRRCEVRKTGPRSFNIILTQGLNRQIRRMSEYFNFRVTELRRVRVMNVKLGDLPEGRYREVAGKELRELKEELKGNEHGSKKRADKGTHGAAR
ncbi:MAG: pseudouridine synthase [Catonella sp.]|jgi:23S rRNA pseudouridine2604 synthase|nr:pseudouridine synthase [Catonella sp.]